MSKIIRNDVLNWLLEDENPEVKYRTMIELLDMPKDKSEVKKAYNLSLIHIFRVAVGQEILVVQ